MIMAQYCKQLNQFYLSWAEKPVAKTHPIYKKCAFYSTDVLYSTSILVEDIVN